MSKYTWVVSTAIAVCVAMSAYVLHLYSKEKPELLVGVCILSAREHQKERNTIRNTWLKADMGSSLEDRKIRIHVKFVVGMEPCLIPPADRLSTFECKEWIPDISADLTKDFEAFSVMEDFVTGPKVHVLNIKALHQITLKRIGILADITLKEEPLNVSLYDDLTEQELGEVIFSLRDPGIIHKGYRYQPIQPLQVDVGREVELSMDIRSDDKHPFFLGGMALTPDSDTTRHNVHRVQGPATVLVEGLRDDRTLIRTDNTTSLFSLLSFMYAVDDVESLKEHTEGREQRRALWLREQARERLALNKELEELDDFLLVQGVDVYRSLPSKVLQCHKWFADNFEARHILKTDDDTFVNVKGIVDRLSTRPLQGHEWWANFRHGSVHRVGKWREPDYSPAVYPNFPCGSGYVVSRDLHLWLVANKDVLHSFQGEDVSMGIWLTPLAPTLIHDTRWQCYKICQDDMLSMPDLTPEEVTLRWQQYTKCSSPCTAC